MSSWTLKMNLFVLNVISTDGHFMLLAFTYPFSLLFLPSYVYIYIYL